MYWPPLQLSLAMIVLTLLVENELLYFVSLLHFHV